MGAFLPVSNIVFSLQSKYILSIKEKRYIYQIGKDEFMIKHILSLVILLASPFVANAQENQRYQLSTHILDISSGKPASGVAVRLFRQDAEGGWQKVDSGITDANGRIADFLPETKDNFGVYKLSFETQKYFSEQKNNSIYPYVDVVFQINENTHYHIPIVMSANGYSTYRGN